MPVVYRKGKRLPPTSGEEFKAALLLYSSLSESSYGGNAWQMKASLEGGGSVGEEEADQILNVRHTKLFFHKIMQLKNLLG